MIFEYNQRVLKNINPVLGKLMENEGKEDLKVVKEVAKTGKSTMKMLYKNEYIYTNSKYDPEHEADNYIKQLKLDNSIKHIFFIGTGMGYHIEKILSNYNHIEYSIYEPNLRVLENFLSEVNLSKFKSNKLVNLFSHLNQIAVESLIEKVSRKSQTIIFPITKKVNNNEVGNVLEIILAEVKNKQYNLHTSIAYQKRWVYNSIKNFPKVINTPNIFMDIKKEYFKDKPVVLVSAGPSLTYEFENLRYIKEKGLAYIISVGSAINALIEQNILPDMACTYDPSVKNQAVFEKIKSKNIKDVPLVFGSTVGFETIENYPGPLVHMLTSQDKVAESLLDTSKNIDIVFDAPSIAIVAFQMLVKLNVSEVILVGQNFGFLKDKRYAVGIHYDFVANELDEAEKKSIIQIESVEGELIATSNDFLRMKNNLEYVIRDNSHVPVYNTTRYGAKIEGTTFTSLKDLIRSRLNLQNITDKNWWQGSSSYEVRFIEKQFKAINQDYQKITEDCSRLKLALNKVQQAVEANKINKLENLYFHFDQEFLKFKNNSFYSMVIEPLIRVQNELLSEYSKEIKYEQNVRKKANLILEAFRGYLDTVNENYNFIAPVFEEFKIELKKNGVLLYG